MSEKTYVDIVGVTGSIPVPPTILTCRRKPTKADERLRRHHQRRHRHHQQQDDANHHFAAGRTPYLNAKRTDCVVLKIDPTLATGIQGRAVCV